MSTLKRFKKSLRVNQTLAENRLWHHLRNRQFLGLKFRRQHILLGYIVDFVCIERRLIIEVDGGQHAGSKIKEDYRTNKLERAGYQVVRFWNKDVLANTEGVFRVLEDLCTPSPGATRRPLPHFGGEVNPGVEFSPDTSAGARDDGERVEGARDDGARSMFIPSDIFYFFDCLLS